MRLSSVRCGDKFTLGYNGMRYKHVGYDGKRIKVKCIDHDVAPAINNGMTCAPNCKVKLDT